MMGPSIAAGRSLTGCLIQKMIVPVAAYQCPILPRPSKPGCQHCAKSAHLRPCSRSYRVRCRAAPGSVEGNRKIGGGDHGKKGGHVGCACCGQECASETRTASKNVNCAPPRRETSAPLARRGGTVQRDTDQRCTATLSGGSSAAASGMMRMRSTGRITRTVVPFPLRLSMSRRPPCSSVSRLASGRPRPVPS